MRIASMFIEPVALIIEASMRSLNMIWCI